LYVAIATALGSSSTLFEMLRSDNADATTPTFTNLTNTPNFGGSGGQGWYDWIIGVDPLNSANIYCAGALNYNSNTNHAIRSTNSGASWADITVVNSVQPHTDSHGMAFDSSSRLILGNDGGIWRYDPTTPSWTNLNSNLNTIQFTGIGLHPTASQTIVGGSQDNGTELTTGNMQWNAVDGGDGGFSQISQTNSLICYANHPIGSFGVSGFFRVSTDGCSTFSNRTPSVSNANGFNFYSPIFVDPTNGNRVFLGGDKLYESANAGSSWASHTSPSSNAIDAIAVLPGGNTIYLATGGTFATSSQVWVSTNDGLTWTEHDLPASSGRVNEIDIDPNDSTGNTAVAVTNTFSGSSANVFRTINSGATWSSIAGSGQTALPAVPAWSAKIDTDASKTLYVSNETAVYSSPSPYGTWSAVGTGLPHAQGVNLQLNSSLHELALATHGRGAWYISVAPQVAAPTISKAFAPSTIVSGGNSTVTLTLTNSSSSAQTSAAFTDTLTNMSAVGGAVTGTCSGTTPTSLSASQTALSFSGITVPASGSCTVIFSVTSSNVGSNPNTTSAVTSTQANVAGSGSNTANLTVNAVTTISNVTSTAANQTYGIGAVIPVVVTFSSAVTVTGTPQLALNSGGTANYSSGSGTTSLTFNYTVASGQATSHLEYTSSSALTLNGGTINDGTPAAANLTLPTPGTAGSLSANKNIVIDGIAPTVSSYSVLFGNTSFNLGTSSRNRLPWQITGIRVVFSKPVNAVTGSLTGVSATGISGSGNSTVTWTLSAIANLASTTTKILGTTANAVTDLAGNPLGGGVDFSQVLKVLYGDFVDDGVVNSADFAGVNSARNQAYNLFADLNGDGVVDVNDVNIARARVGNTNP
jgi:hypothetical protein